MSHGIPPGMHSWEFMPGLLWTAPPASFPSANFALYPFTVINHSHEHNYTLSSVSPPSKSPNLEVVLGTHDCYNRK